jgi:hypothetical protein
VTKSVAQRRSLGAVIVVLVTMAWFSASAGVAGAESTVGVMTVDDTVVRAGEPIRVTQVTPCPATEGVTAHWAVQLGAPEDPLVSEAVIVDAGGAAGDPIALTVPPTSPAGEVPLTASCVADSGGAAETTTLTYAPITISIEARPVGTFAIDPPRGPTGTVSRVTTDDACPPATLPDGIVSFSIGFADPDATQPPFAIGQRTIDLGPDGTIAPFDLTVPSDARPGGYTVFAYCSEAIPGFVIKTMLFEDRPFEVLASEPTSRDVTYTGALSLDRATVPAGQSLTVTGSGYAPGGTVDLTVSGTKLGEAVVDDAGGFIATVGIPAEIAVGRHTITGTERDVPIRDGINVLGVEPGTALLTVTPPVSVLGVVVTLPRTGLDQTPLTAAAIVLVGTGGLLCTAEARIGRRRATRTG